jgi:hypothetical protein
MKTSFAGSTATSSGGLAAGDPAAEIGCGGVSQAAARAEDGPISATASTERVKQALRIGQR